VPLRFYRRFGGSRPNRPNLDRAPSRHRTTCGPFKRFVQVWNIDHNDTADQFLAFGKGPILYSAFAISNSDRGGGLRRLKSGASDKYAGFSECIAVSFPGFP
jgi:hypothetical protein